MIKRSIIGLLMFVLTLPIVGKVKKQEFRGVWIQTVWQTQYAKMSRAEMQYYFVNMLDRFQSIGINALLFQVRPQADAFYQSAIEPYSKFFTGEQGKAPSQSWDPMEFLISECHHRGIEFHAWINPFRLSINDKDSLSKESLYFKKPNWFIKYGNQIYFDPSLPQCRQRVFDVVDDIVTRYDVDAIHIDDYFYPYPLPGIEFPDDDSFQLLREKQGFSPNQKSDWRRNNINQLISGLHKRIKEKKNWVQFGVSPFGIYKNNMSNTRGLEAYSDLYADILLWDKNGWIDYVIPQLYWEIGNKRADYMPLLKWWNDNISNSDLYIGENVVRTINATDAKKKTSNQLTLKMNTSRSLNNIKGTCFWSGYDLLNNYGGVTDSLTNNYYQTRALIPVNNANSTMKAPSSIRRPRFEQQGNTDILTWNIVEEKDTLYKATKYCIYRFRSGDRVNINNVQAIYKVTDSTRVHLPRPNSKITYQYVVTPINRYNIEGKESSVVGISGSFFERFFRSFIKKEEIAE